MPLHIRELRKSREWTQPELAKRAGMKQPRISELEKPGERKLSIETLLRLASAFDVGLQVRFVSIGELIDWSENLDLDNFGVEPFIEELRKAEEEEAKSVAKELLGKKVIPWRTPTPSEGERAQDTREKIEDLKNPIAKANTASAKLEELDKWLSTEKPHKRFMPMAAGGGAANGTTNNISQ